MLTDIPMPGIVVWIAIETSLYRDVFFVYNQYNNLGDDEMNMSLSIPEWHRMAMEGVAPPVRIPLNGYSMFPLVRKGRDFVTVIPPDRELVPGDIVMIAEPDTGRYVMHRVWELRDGEVLTWGDHCVGPDRWVPMDAVWGRAILIERGSWEIHPDPVKGKKWAKFWHQAGKAYRLYERYRNGIIRRIKKLFV